MKFLLPFLLGFAIIANAQPGDAPPNAQPGKCYAKCLIADQYETTTEQVQVKAASSKTVAVPAEYGSTSEQIMVKAPFLAAPRIIYAT